MAVTRRQVLVAGGALALGALAGSPSQAARKLRPRIIYRLSCRGRRASPAVKIWNANLRFRSRAAARRHRKHPGDTSRIVPLTVSGAEFARLFPLGLQVVDLRHPDCRKKRGCPVGA
jgi:hypothetical protein